MLCALSLCCIQTKPAAPHTWLAAASQRQQEGPGMDELLFLVLPWTWLPRGQAHARSCASLWQGVPNRRAWRPHTSLCLHRRDTPPLPRAPCCSLELSRCDWRAVKAGLEKARGLCDKGGDWERKNKLKVRPVRLPVQPEVATLQCNPM